MKKVTSILKKAGEKMAASSIVPLCHPFIAYQPKPPAKLLKKAGK